jgi:hypothetical protein
VKKIMNLAKRNISVHTLKGLLTCRKIYDKGANGFTSTPKKGFLRIFIVIKNPSPSASFEPENLRSSGKHTDHYTTEDDIG